MSRPRTSLQTSAEERNIFFSRLTFIALSPTRAWGSLIQSLTCSLDAGKFIIEYHTMLFNGTLQSTTHLQLPWMRRAPSCN